MSGKRNEAARERRRRMVYSEGDLVSMSRTELETETFAPRHKNWTLENHFGWTVLGQTQLENGNVSFMTSPHGQKSEVRGPSSEKAMYALYLDKGTMTDQNTLVKETQTKIRDRLHSRADHIEVITSTRSLGSDQALIHKPRSATLKERPQEKKRRRLIHEFYSRDSTEENQTIQETETKVRDGFHSKNNESTPLVRRIRLDRSPLKTLISATSIKSGEPKKPPEEMNRRKLIHSFYSRDSAKSFARSKEQNDMRKGAITKSIDDLQGGANPYLLPSYYSVQEQVTTYETREKDMYPSKGSKATSSKQKIDGPQPVSDDERSRRHGGQDLRAGAEIYKSNIENVQLIHQNTSGSIKFLDKLKPKLKHEYLLDTPSGINKYLYVSRKRSKTNIFG